MVRETPLVEIKVCDGWELSYGCLLDGARAGFDRGIAVVDEREKTMTRESAQHLVEASVARASNRGFDLSFLQPVLTAPWETVQLEQPHA